MERERNLQDMSVTEIKAILYDQIVILEKTNNNIQILQNRLEELIKQETPETPETTETPEED